MKRCDFLVIGSGIAGLSFALKSASFGRVILLCKTVPPESNTRYAQGGIAAVWDADDTFESHVEDTLVAGAGLCRREVVELTVREGPERVRELIEQGVSFSAQSSGEYDLGREGGHSARRVLHAKDQTGAAIMRALLERVSEHPEIELLDCHMAIDLITDSWLARRAGRIAPVPDRVRGAYVLDVRSGGVQAISSKVTVLCTGGAGKVYRYTSNPDIASGDGVAMAYRAGARVANMEFTQFHPTCLFHAEAKNFLITEAMRGEGGKLRLSDGRRFMSDYDERLELAPRDIVARAIDAELKRTGDDCVFLDMTHESRMFLEDRFPGIFTRCQELGIDISTDPIPVVPAAHYFCGGVQVDTRGETSLRDLFALGEVSCTGLHGANRLASNSLLEAVVYAHRAVSCIVDRLDEAELVEEIPVWDPGTAVDSDEQVVITQTWDEIRTFMWNYVGIVRTTRRLKRARHRVDLVQDEIRHYYWDFRLSGDLIELRNLATVAGLVVESALRRRESRGLHYTLDYPDSHPRWMMDTVLQRRW